MFIRTPGAADLARINQADEARTDLDFGPAESFAVQNGPKTGDLIRHNVLNYLDLFSSRQLLYINQAIWILREVREANQVEPGTTRIYILGV